MALVLMAWGESAALKDRFELARQAWSDDSDGQTYQGFIKALLGAGLGLLFKVQAALRRRLVEVAGPHARPGGFFVLAVDGSRFELPRTAQNERVFGVAEKTGAAPAAPQVWVTLLWHMGVGLPWMWRVGRGNASERDHLRQMISHTPADTLFVEDAGYTGYDLLSTIVHSGRHFLLRVGKSVELLRDLGYVEHADGQTVYLWPAYAQRDRQPPLVLRLIKVRSTNDRRRKMYLLTSVRDAERLSDEQAAVWYRMRWGVELCYRSLKETMAAHKLRSHAPANVLFELHGALLGLTLLGLMSLAPILAAGHTPLSWSTAAALRAVRRAMRQPSKSYDWSTQLAAAIKDDYPRRCKTRRRWPRKKQHNAPPGRPCIRKARANEIALYRQLCAN